MKLLLSHLSAKDDVLKELNRVMDYVERLLVDNGISITAAGYLSYAIVMLIIIILCIIINLICKKIILNILSRIIKNNKYIWDNVLLDRGVFKRFINMIPGIIIYISSPIFVNIEEVLRRLAASYLIITAALVLSSLLDSIDNIYRLRPISKTRPIKGLLQVIKIIAFIILGIVMIANMMGQSPIILLSGIGAIAAVFSFVFKDSILGFIAGIQLTTNNMLQIGDWIDMPQYGADGNVIDITLNTVKVQNFDKSIVTIPAYALISDSFKNWRGMQEAGGRRIKRSIYIDINSIGFCTEEMLKKFKRIGLLKAYINEKEKEIHEYNQSLEGDKKLLINGRHLTNIGTFRVYIINYLKANPKLNNNMIQMVRQLPPGEFGLPLEIYVFTSDTKWEIYETIQADIFDHILAVAGEFGLRIYQKPTGFDVKHINIMKDE